MRTLIREIDSNRAGEVELCGWVHRIRSLGAISFILLRDRSGIVQLVWQGAFDCTLESVIRVRGRVAANPKAPGGYEIHVTPIDGAPAVEILASAAPDLPLPVNRDLSTIGLESLLDHRPLALRNPRLRHIFSLQSVILKYFASYLRSLDFTEIKTSKLIQTGTEGGAGLFEVLYFDSRLYLAQSPQFYKQALVASGMERVFEIGHAYRAEKHETPRHLNEYVSLDVEVAFIEDERALIDLEIGILQAICAGLRNECADILEEWSAELPTTEQIAAIPRLNYDEARQILGSLQGRRVYEIGAEAERHLCDWALQQHGIDAVFISGYPRRKRPFYTYPRGQSTMSFDLLFRGLEITTGGRRIEQYAMLLESLRLFGMSEETLEDYLRIFKYGCPPHGGFAIGLERLTQKMLGLQNVREATLFPRDRRRTRP